MDTIQKLESFVGPGRVKKNFDISPYMTLKTHVSAAFYFVANTREDLVNAVKASHQTKIPLFLMGGGSNMAVLHNTLDFFVVHNRYSGLELISEDETSALVGVSSGYPVAQLVRYTVERGYGGFENHLGLPGTVGGAIYMNSKWTRPLSYFGESLTTANIIDKEGTIKKVSRDYFQFAYDYSILHKTHEIVLEAEFKLVKMDKALLLDKSKEALAYRKETQPYGVFSSGCFFRNISAAEQKKYALPATSAGYLIDKAGLKGFKIGSYYVSPKHANFILNQGEGQPKDLMRLLEHIKHTVREKFGIELKEEVNLI